MRYVKAHPDLPPVSRIAFGCASLGGRVGKREGLRALALAHDSGINLFDTARSYGFGRSERILGDFIRTRPRDSVMVMTKAGVAPPRFGIVEGAARALAARARGRPSAPGSRPGDPTLFTPRQLRSSLERSLCELRTDHVDVFLLHAMPAAVLARDEIFEFVARIRAEGKARLVGVSGPSDVVFEALDRHSSSVDAMQYAVDARTILVDAGRAAPADRLRCLMQPFAGGMLARQMLLQHQDTLQQWCDGRTPGECVPRLLVASVLELASPPAPVLVSAWKREHILSNCQLAADAPFPLDTLMSFARWAAGALGSP